MAARILHQPIVGSEKFERWTVLAPAESKYYFDKSKSESIEHRRWLCRCDCGADRVVSEMSLRRKVSKSCGCLQREVASATTSTHRASMTREYRVWLAMTARCRNQNNSRYESYGGRGIKVCERWLSFENFLSDMGLRPSDHHSLDRIKNDLGYFAGNCRWALPHEQMTNRRNTRFVSVNGKDVPLATLAKQYAIPANTLRARILKGWELQTALTAPVRPKAR